MARILVVDDQPELAELIQAVLEGDGHAVDSVLGGQAALERLSEHAYDLVVCDLRMPDIDGAAVYWAVEQLAMPRPAVLLMTGYADSSTFGDFLQTMPGRAEQARGHRCAPRARPAASRESVIAAAAGDRHAPAACRSIATRLTVLGSPRFTRPRQLAEFPRFPSLVCVLLPPWLVESADGGGAMMRVPMLVLVLLGYLAGCAESKAMDGEAVGRFSLELAGLVVAAFLFYLAFSGAIMALFSRRWRRKRRSVKHLGLSDVPGAAASSGNESAEALKARP